MEEKKVRSDAREWLYNRYIKDDPEAAAFLKEVKIQADLAGRIYSIRTKLHMTREELAEFAGLTPEIIEDIEESDYGGDWDEAVLRINRAFRSWVSDVIIPVARMSPEDYSIEAASA